MEIPTIFQGFGITDGQMSLQGHSQDSKNSLDILKALALADLREKHPNIPSHALPKPKYSDRTANGLNRCIIDYITFMGGVAERRNNMGRWLQPKEYTDVFGKKRTLGKGKFIPTPGRNGTADISGIYRGVPLAVEIKIGRDKMSAAQRKYKEDFEAAGGVYIIAKSFDQFYVEIEGRFGDGR